MEMDSKEQEACDSLKGAITNAPVLANADPSKPYFLETNTSGAALGSILSQCQEDRQLHPLGFLSESFKGTEQNYNTHNKELLAIICSFEYWHIFLEGILHVHCCHAQWHLLLARYNFHIVYQPGKQSGKPDALSCCSNPADIPCATQTMLPDPPRPRQIPGGNPYIPSEQVKAPLSIKQAFKDYQMEAGLLFYQGHIMVLDVGTLQTDLLRVLHDNPLVGHPEWQCTLELVSWNYYWPGIQVDTYWHVDSCETCQQIWKPKYAPIPPLPLKLALCPWQHVSYNMIVDLPKDSNCDSILVIVDSFNKYVILVECLKKLKALELTDLFLCHIWKRQGVLDVC
ncbi:Retrotransposable element Tf2 protein [Rhizoctonia solani]|uniref:Retrotransposable element Tf2 protein n=1 Tax=Rhizoctonia solani TaxID=456999 RepID=A0A8H8T1U5_9AGAM|nr:Retrotransposable element Tf2 protein [Rhizoctonia solani]QRW25137.1 Retrotransposable element Tf2 protein [Rhizoctonia solani]